MTFKSKLKIASAMAALALVGAGSAAQAAGLVLNGNFQSSTSGPTVASALTGNPSNSVGSKETLSNWTAQGYAFVFTNTSGAGSTPGGIVLWNLNAAPPLGEDFIGIDPAFLNNPPGTSGISQTINGLVSGNVYTLTFEWAAAQQFPFTGGTSEWWTVGLGSSPTQDTTHFNLSSTSFSGWFDVSMTFTANATSELLTFLAGGTGTASEPPFDLLANVSLTNQTVPEPASIALFGAGIAGLGGLAVARRRKKKA